jgi:outer membrane receptor for ferrienterochelin and colicins
MGTSELESFGNVSVAGKVGKFKAMGGLNYAYMNFFEDQNQDGFGDAANLDRVSLFTKWVLDRPNKKRFSIAGKYYYEDRRNGVEAFLRNRAYRQLRGSEHIYGESIYTRRGEIFGTYQFQLEGLRLDYSLSYHDQNSYYGNAYYAAKQKIAFSNLLYSKRLGNHDLLFGQTTRWNDYDDNTIATQRNGQNLPNRQFIPGVFVQDEWKAGKRLSLLGGARLDHYQGHGLIFSPRFNAKAKFGEWTTLRGNFGTGFRIVNLFTEDHAFVTGQKEVVIAEELRPESSYNFSLDLNRVYLLGKGEGSIDFNAYYTYFFNAIFPDYSQEGKIIYANSKGFAFTKGVGLTINHRFHSALGFSAGINVQRAIEKEEGLSRHIPFAPRWSGVFSANYEIKKKGLYFAYTVKAVGHMALPEVYDLDEAGVPVALPRPTTSAPFAIHNFQVNKSLKIMQLYVGLQNLFNMRPKYSPLAGYNDPNTATGFSPYFDTSYAYAPLHGRELYVGIKWSLK